MRYKKGDMPLVKSREWYDENKGKDGVNCGDYIFIPTMCKFLGKKVTIEEVFNDEYYIKEDDGFYYWNDQMFVDEEMDNEPIKINNIVNDPCFLYSPSGRLIGEIKDDLNFTEVRLQICRKKLEGYYFMFKGIRIDVDKDGGIDNWVDGFFDKLCNMLNEIVLGI